MPSVTVAVCSCRVVASSCCVRSLFPIVLFLSVNVVCTVVCVSECPLYVILHSYYLCSSIPPIHSFSTSECGRGYSAALQPRHTANGLRVYNGVVTPSQLTVSHVSAREPVPRIVVELHAALAQRAVGRQHRPRQRRNLSLYSDGEFFISIANVGSKLAICLQHLIDGNACCCRCCIVFGKWI